jgi:hypothetical protein
MVRDHGCNRASAGALLHNDMAAALADLFEPIIGQNADDLPA